MNLGELHKRVEYELRHAPAVRAHRDEITARLNTALEKLVLGSQWSFRERQVALRLKATVTIASGAWTDNPSVTLPSSDTVTGNVAKAFTFTMPTGWTNADVALFSGQLVTIAGSTTATGNGTWVVESAFVAAGLMCIILDPRFPGHAAVSTEATLTLRWVRYRLPPDCADTMAIVLRADNKGRLTEVPLRREESWLLREDDSTGTPRAFLVAPNHIDPYPNESTYHLPYVDVQAPAEAPTLSSANSTGTLTNSATYEYAYAWLAAGMTSGPSPTARITLGASDDTVTIANLEDYGASGDPFGRYKLIYRRQLFTDYEGPWVIANSTYSYSTSVTDTNARPWPSADAITTGRVRLSGESSPSRHIRVWPMPSEDIEAELRYFARAPRMETPADVPELPPELHMALVYDVALDLAATQDGSASLVRHLTSQRDELVNIARRLYRGSSSVRTVLGGVLERRGGGWTPRINPPEFS